MSSEHITIGDITPWTQYEADGLQTEFGFSFPIFDSDDLEVYLGSATVPESAGYAVSGAGGSSGGWVTFDTPPGAGVAVTILRNVAIKRVTDFSESGDFRASVINNELDRLTAIAQQLSNTVTRAVRLADTDAAGTVQLPAAADRAGKIAAFDGVGGLIAATLASSELLVSALMETVLVETTAAGVRSALSAQAQSDDLDDIAALTPAEGEGLVYSGGAWTAARAVAEAEIRRLALDVAALKGDRENMVDGIADPFADATDIDAAESTNEILLAASYFKGLTEANGNAMQDAKTGSNGTTLSGTNPHAGIRWTQSGDQIALGIRVDFHAVGTPGNVDARLYVAGNSTIVAQSAAVAVSAAGVVDFDFAAPYLQSDGVDYVAAIRRTSGEFTLSTVTADGTDVTYSNLSGSDLHSMAADGNKDSGEDFRMGLIVGATANLLLTSEAFTADAQPDAALLHVQVVENEAITINTDLIGRVTRDDGDTWTTAVLVLVDTLADGTKLYEAVGIDISGQPAGTSMRYQIETDNTKDVEIHGVVLKWS